ncbi:hypothetical protein F5X96DRAFT_682013 [Biscogniauxia mediterranea]|nr:hypothetical protein F5X96DRAFT_682013 [Biscogniauxia mediterranea]
MPPAVPTVAATDVNSSTDNNAPLVYTPAWIFLFICPIVVGTRIWSRTRKGGKLGADDYTILASLSFALVSGAIMLVACHYGYGHHRSSLSPDEIYQSLKYFYLCQITYKSSINLTKASILLLYLRIFTGVRWFRLACAFVLTSVVMYCIASVTATIFQCTPITGAFDKTIEYHCIDNSRFWFANAGFSIATDIVILTLPMPLVYSLQIPRIQKIALIVVFTLGVFVVITSCLRVTTIDLQAKSPDPLYDVASTMWTIIEMNVAVICACLPQIRPLIVKLFPKLMPASYGSRDKPSNQPGPGSSASKKSYLDSQQKPEQDRWTPAHGQEGVHLTNIQRGETSSEECMIHRDDKALQIQKTVQYSVEYSGDDRAYTRI